jgi:hypothetical protein
VEQDEQLLHAAQSRAHAASAQARQAAARLDTLLNCRVDSEIASAFVPAGEARTSTLRAEQLRAKLPDHGGHRIERDRSVGNVTLTAEE